MSPTCMCDNCKNILVDYRGKPHDIGACPILSMAYCGLCSKRGHFHNDCPDVISLRMRKPEYVEQLIPPSLRERYKIQSLTPLPVKNPEVPTLQSVWELPMNSKYIKDFLMERKQSLDKHSLEIKTTGKAKKDNMQTVEKLAAILNCKVLWLKSKRYLESNEEEEFEGETNTAATTTQAATNKKPKSKSKKKATTGG